MKMGVGRDFRNNPCHGIWSTIVNISVRTMHANIFDVNDFVQWIYSPEVCFSLFLCQNQGIWFTQNSFDISFYQGQTEYLKEVGVYNCHFAFADGVIPLGDYGSVRGLYNTGSIHDFGEVIKKGLG